MIELNKTKIIHYNSHLKWYYCLVIMTCFVNYSLLINRRFINVKKYFQFNQA